MSGSIKTTNGKNADLYRSYTVTLSASSNLPITKAQLGVSNGTPNIADTSLDNPIPISDGTTLDDGSNTLTGSSGGDNSTDNTTTYKEGAGNSDVTAQNLIKNNTNATAIWTISNLASAGTNATASSLTGLWFYVKDSTALAKFVSSGTALEIKLGSDSSNYYSITYEDGDLVTGWNWLPFGVLSDLTETGTVSGDIDTFIIEITTNNATDTFVSGDVVYDLLRQWVTSDTFVSIDSGYPTFNTSTLQVENRVTIGTTKANGFLINSVGWFSDESTPVLRSIDVFDGKSKSSTDAFIFIMQDRAI